MQNLHLKTDRRTGLVGCGDPIQISEGSSLDLTTMEVCRALPCFRSSLQSSEIITPIEFILGRPVEKGGIGS